MDTKDGGMFNVKEATITELQDYIAHRTQENLGKIRGIYNASRENDARFFADSLQNALAKKIASGVTGFAAAAVLTLAFFNAGSTGEKLTGGFIGGAFALASAGFLASGRREQKAVVQNIKTDIGTGPKI